MRTTMPGSVRLSLAALAVEMALFLGSGVFLIWHGHEAPVQLPIAAALSALLAWALATRRRLGWLWGRYMGFFLLLAAVAGVAMERRLPPVDAAGALVGAVVFPFLAVSLALGRRAAHEWFRLVCPRCGATATRGDALMRKVRCPGCGESF